jgi:predicted nucleotidyltransferase
MTKQEMIQQIAEYFKTQPVLKVWIFGSFSRGEEREDSDVDILIVPDGGERIAVYTLDGKTITSVTGQKEKTELSLPGSGTYIIKVNENVFKVAL